MIFTFTESQSSAIASFTIKGQEVSISFRSNPSNVYTFVTECEDVLIDYLKNPSGSIGQTYHQWVNNKVLIPTEQLAAV
jgi:hypothetical protein